MIVILATALVVLVYGVAGGIRAAVLTDIIQTGLVLFLTFLLIPLGFSKGGGLPAARQAIPDHFLNLSLITIKLCLQLNRYERQCNSKILSKKTARTL